MSCQILSQKQPLLPVWVCEASEASHPCKVHKKKPIKSKPKKTVKVVLDKLIPCVMQLREATEIYRNMMDKAFHHGRVVEIQQQLINNINDEISLIVIELLKSRAFYSVEQIESYIEAETNTTVCLTFSDVEHQQYTLDFIASQ